MKLWVRVILTLVSSAAYLLLGVLGWGSFAAFFAHPALIALTVVLCVVALWALGAGGNLSSGVREDRDNRWVLLWFAAIGLAIGFVPAWTDRLGFWTLDGDAIRWPGVALFAGGCVLRIWPVFVLGDRFSGLVAIQPGHTLVTTGIYGTIRNPSYLGMLVMLLGWSLAFRAGAGLLLTALIVPPLVARMNAEERILHEQFGAAYDAYRARTWRLIPWAY